MNVTAQAPVSHPIDADRVLEPGRVRFRTQAPGDVAAAERVVPRDQERLFRARWDGVHLDFVEVSPAEIAAEHAARGALPPASTAEEEAAAAGKLAALPDPELKTLAATLKVPWDKKASRDTMVARVRESQRKAAAAEPAQASGGDGE